MDIFQQWLLLKIKEHFGGGEEPQHTPISFEAIGNLIGPIFEQEDAPLDEVELQRNLDALVELGYLKGSDGIYHLTFRALVYAEASQAGSQLVRDQMMQLLKLYGWKALAIALAAVILISLIVSAITVSVLT